MTAREEPIAPRDISGIHTVFAEAKTPLQELLVAAKAWPVWFHLSLNDIRAKYRRTTLGPWWLVIGMGIALGLMAILWSAIFGIDWRQYLPYIMIGFICWHWMSGYVTLSCDMFSSDFSGLLRSLPTPPIIYAMRFIMRGFWLFLHNLPTWFFSALITGIWPTPVSILLLPLGLIMVMLTGLSVALLFGMLGARFRDFTPAVSAVMMPMMMLTPVIWRTDMLGPYELFAQLNPFTHYLAIVRDPLLGHLPSMFNYTVTSTITVSSVALAAWCYHRYRRSLILWI